ncbi:MAG: hypothetical protein HY787_02835 [Deltaproteobacteria bacterium]|nr:hypothetical protein [Deltaproteobacteria bacterium]
MLAGPIGIDLDNTIVSYDEVLFRVAEEAGLIGPDVDRNKKAIRDFIRTLPDGEIEWQKIQAMVYGPRISEAKLIAGVADFLACCRNRSIRTYIISHKTEYANYDRTGTNLRQAALEWIRNNKLFPLEPCGSIKTLVFFGSTRLEKTEYIRSLKCTCFIDDLIETFLEPSFPTGVVKILFDPHHLHRQPSGMEVFSSWKDLPHRFFSGQS